MTGPVDPGAIPALCLLVRRLLEQVGAETVVCDVRALGPPDPAALEAVARVRLTARRLGRSMYLSGACPRLQDLLVIAGLDDVLPVVNPCGRARPMPTGQRPVS